MVQIHRCPATVSGTKSAETTEAPGLGKVQRVESCREPGDLPYMALRRPFEGKGRQLVWADPDHSWSGFFYACCFPSRGWLDAFLPCGGSVEEGKQAVVPPAAVLPSFPPLARLAAWILPPGVNAQHAAEAEERMLTALVSTVARTREHGAPATRPCANGWAGASGARASRATWKEGLEPSRTRHGARGRMSPRGVW